MNLTETFENANKFDRGIFPKVPLNLIKDFKIRKKKKIN